MYRKLSVFYSAFLAASSLFANLVPNGSFDNVWIAPNQERRPSEWTWGGTPGSRCTFKLEENAQGYCVHASSKTLPKPHVFSSMDTRLRLLAGITYQLTLNVKGEAFFVALGRKWRRFHVETSKDYHVQAFTFSLNQEEIDANGMCPLKLVFEKPGEYYIGDISIVPIQKNVPDVDHQNRKIYRIENTDTEFRKWRKIPGQIKKFYLPLSRAYTSTGMAQQFDAQRTVDIPETKDFLGEVAFLYDRDGLVFLAEISDDLKRVVAGENMWTGDCIQLRFDCAAQRAESGKPTDVEIGYSIDENNLISTFCWTGPERFSGNELPLSVVNPSVFKKDNGYFLVSHISWSLLGADGTIPDRIGFSVAITDSDRPGHRTVYFLTSGIHDRKGSDEFIYGFIDKQKPSNWFYAKPKIDNSMEGQLCAVNQTGTLDFTAELTDRNGNRFSHRLGRVNANKNDLIRFDFNIPLEKLVPGEFSAVFQLNGELLQKINAEKFNPYEKSLAQLLKLQRRLEYLKEERKLLYQSVRPSQYIDVPLFILELKLNEYATHLNSCQSTEEKDYYGNKFLLMLPETQEAMLPLEKRVQDLKNGKRPPEAFRYVSGDITMNDGWPEGAVKDEDGNITHRPLVFGGFGAFKSCRDNIENQSRMGVNIIQQEIGPDSLFPREGKTEEFEPDFSRLDAFLNDFLERAWNHNISVDLLISPHYVPKWLKEKYPDMKAEVRYCFDVEVNHPKMHELVDVYLKYLIPHIRKHPFHRAIKSICLTNEPSYVNCTPENALSLKLFRNYLMKTYGNIDAFNRKAKRNYPSFDEFIQNGLKDPAFRYDFYRFSRIAFADFHRRLADGVKKYWPGMAVHAKAMAFRSFYEYDSGVDPEMFASFSDYNGNDGGSTWNVGQLAAETEFINRNGLQRSCRKLSIVNSENHLITDREKRAIPNRHIYQEMFEQYATGASTIITWRYAPAWFPVEKNAPHSTAIGSIYHRPGNLVAHGMAYIDALRLAPILKKIYQYEPEVGMVYSMSSILQGKSGRQGKDVSDFFFSAGYQLRYITENQLASRDWGNLKVIYAVGIPNLSQDAMKGLQDFVKDGGTLYIDEISARTDEYDNPTEVKFPNRFQLFHDQMGQEQITRLSKLPVSLKTQGKGIFFRVIPYGNGNAWVNIVNYNAEIRAVELQGNGKLFDLIEHVPSEKQLVLRPLEVKLFQFETAGQ